MKNRVRISLGAGGWVLILAALLAAALVLWAFAGVLSGHRRLGGGDLASYGFDLSTCLIDRSAITPSGQPRDFLRPLAVAGTMPGSAMAEFNKHTRKRYVVSDDRVVGLVINGKARAYPLYLLNGHEVIEDTLGETPIVVTYSPLCDVVSVYERTVSGAPVHLRVSGLLHNANSLLYDDSPQPSLWRQIDGKAISGPFAERGAVLAPINIKAVTTWGDWLATHPETDLPERPPENIRLYDNISYVREHASAKLAFPVTPTPSDVLPLKETVLLLTRGSDRAAYAYQRLRAEATNGVVRCEVGGTPVTIHLPTSSEPTWRVEETAGEPIQAKSGFWFAMTTLLEVDQLSK